MADNQLIEVHNDIALPLHEVGEHVHLDFNHDIINVFDANTELSVMKKA
jgi:hypothetical protein